MDVYSGFWQIPMNPNDIKKTAFTSPLGLLEWRFMPFGLTNAPATFQAVMEKVLAPVLWKTCVVYLLLDGGGTLGALGGGPGVTG